MKSRFLAAILWLVTIGAAIVLCGANLFLGDLNQDEGWYLYAARLVSEGKLPYIDFASTQGPVMPAVYALAQPLVSAFGLAGGRLFTSILGLSTAVCAAWLAGRLAPDGRRREAALIGFALLTVNVYQSYFCTIVKTYALTGLFLTLGFLALSFLRGRSRILPVVLSGVFLGLASATRTSAGAVIPVVFILLLWPRKNNAGNGDGAEPMPTGIITSLWFAAGVAFTLGLAFLPFVLNAWESVWFALVEYHAGRETQGLVKQLAFKVGFVSRVVHAYFVAVAAGLLIAVLRLTGSMRGNEVSGESSEAPSVRPNRFTMMLWCGALSVTLLHLFAPFPYDDYQVIIYPVYVVAISLAVVRAFPSLSRGVLSWIVVSLCLFSSLSSPINQGWFVGKRDRIWWPLKEESPLTRLQRTGRLISGMTRPGDLLLTQDPYLAIETGLSLPSGLELGPFSYFPEWDREYAARRHVLNREMMHELLRTSAAPVAAFSGYGLSISSPSVGELSEEEQRELRETLESRYRLFREVEDFGQAETTLRVYLLGSSP